MSRHTAILGSKELALPRVYASPGRAGFTLIELMIVLVLMAILAAMIVPEMKGTLAEERLRATGRQLIRACQLAYSQSVTLHQRHRVRIDSRAGHYQVERLATAKDSTSGFLALPNLPDSVGRFDRRIRVEIGPADAFAFVIPDPELPPDAEETPDPWSSAEAILFFPDGRAEAKEMRLRDPQGFEVALRINPVNGRVQWSRNERR
jgi:type II secretion system protein H